MTEFQELYNGVHKYEILESRFKQLKEKSEIFEYILEVIQDPKNRQKTEKLDQYQHEVILETISVMTSILNETSKIMNTKGRMF